MGLKMLCSKNWRRFSLPYDLKKMLHVFMRQQARAAILAAGAGRGWLRNSTDCRQQASALGQHMRGCNWPETLVTNLGEDEASTGNP